MSVDVITKPKVKIDADLLAQLKPETEGQVILHFLIRNRTPFPAYIRIWKTSYLYPHTGGRRSSLQHVENICFNPDWQQVPSNTNTYFTLIFSSLPKSCDVFDFIEECANEGGAFSVKNIARNEQDVYYFQIN